MSDKRSLGCGFLFSKVGVGDIFTPEDFTEEQTMIAKTALDFMKAEVLPHSEEIEAKNIGLVVELLKKAGDAGLLAIDVPEAYGGLDLDKASSMLVTESMVLQGSFGVSFGAHVGIGTLPIVYFGTAEQKEKYLPSFISGEMLSAYALTEPSAGSDALNAKTKAVLNEAGTHYIINGTKQFITNAAFADVFVVFAKVNGEQFTGFIVEKADKGVSVGPEEKKMGIRGSSTAALILEDVEVPVDRVLGQIGKGHKIAFNILNFGRFKLGVGNVGGCKNQIRLAILYAKDRKQFGKSLTEFGAIQQMLAEMAAQTYAAESAAYRLAGCYDDLLASIDKAAPDGPEQVICAIEEYAVEASILKVFGSEVGADVVDKAVQIHGGYGFIQEYSCETAYRDNRVGRIYEGTNEINRMLIPGTLVKRTMKGQVDLYGLIGAVTAEAQKGQAVEVMTGPLGLERTAVEQLKKIYALVMNQAINTFGLALQEQQEVLLGLADLLIDIYASDSTIARALKRIQAVGEVKAKAYTDCTTVFTTMAWDRSLAKARRLLCSMAQGDDLKKVLLDLHHLSFLLPTDLVAVKRAVAAFFIDREDYRL